MGPAGGRIAGSPPHDSPHSAPPRRAMKRPRDRLAAPRHEALPLRDQRRQSRTDTTMFRRRARRGREPHIDQRTPRSASGDEVQVHHPTPREPPSQSPHVSGNRGFEDHVNLPATMFPPEPFQKLRKFLIACIEVRAARRGTRASFLSPPRSRITIRPLDRRGTSSYGAPSHVAFPRVRG